MHQPAGEPAAAQPAARATWADVALGVPPSMAGTAASGSGPGSVSSACSSVSGAEDGPTKAGKPEGEGAGSWLAANAGLRPMTVGKFMAWLLLTVIVQLSWGLYGVCTRYLQVWRAGWEGGALHAAGRAPHLPNGPPCRWTRLSPSQRCS